MSVIKQGSTILFQGDSVTDCGRDKDDANSMGTGYAYIVSALLKARYPEAGLNFFNRGISGNRTKDLLSRWDEDCISLNPDVVSILIGVNNTWRKYDSNDPTPVETFASELHNLLTRTKAALDPVFVICEPFVLPFPEDRKTWREDLDPKITVIRELSHDFNAVYVPFDGMFVSSSTRIDPAHWAPDGVHPSDAGHALMAEEWISRVVGSGIGLY